MLRSTLVLACAAVLTAAGCAAIKSKANPYEVVMVPTAGNHAAGKLAVTEVPNGVHFQGTITGLAPGSTHGFHIHVHGDCSASDASTAGDHFNPTATEHGDPAGMIHHAGDIANQVADAQGDVHVDVTVHGVSISTGTSDDVIGRSLILHADPDDYATQPSGNSGARIACGVILKTVKP